MRKEDSRSITTWGEATFGIAETQKLYDRLLEEYKEFCQCPTMKEAGQELADISILLHQIAKSLGFNLDEEVDKKMAINRKREWIVNSDKIGRHK